MFASRLLELRTESSLCMCVHTWSSKKLPTRLNVALAHSLAGEMLLEQEMDNQEGSGMDSVVHKGGTRLYHCSLLIKAEAW